MEDLPISEFKEVFLRLDRILSNGYIVVFIDQVT